MSNEKRAPGCLGYIVGDEILPSCVVIEMNQPGFHGKDPAVFFFVAQVDQTLPNGIGNPELRGIILKQS